MKAFALTKWLAFGLAVFLLASCNIIGENGDGEGGGIPEIYKDFHKYPAGRQDPNGLLTIENQQNSEVLLFIGSVDPANYIGTVSNFGNIQVTLPSEQFYTIVAVDKKTWEANRDQAFQFSDLTYFSRTVPYSMKVNPSSMSGGGTWLINNFTTYWVTLRSSSGSGETYAVVAPNAKRVSVPVQFNTSYDYVPHFYKEVKFGGKVISLVEFDDQRQSDVIQVRQSDTNKSRTTDIGNGGISAPASNIKPVIYVTNHSNKGVRIYQGTNNQLNTGGSSVMDFVLESGGSQLFTGLETDTNVNAINFYSNAFTETTGRVYVSQDIKMAKNTVYKIELSGSDPYTTSVTSQEAEAFFEEHE